jgi:plastocyanin
VVLAARVTTTPLCAGVLLVSLATEALGQGVVQGQVEWRGSSLPNAVVQFVSARAASPLSARDSAFMDQNHLRFVPEVLAVTTGTTVVFVNSDPNLHNVFSPNRRGAGFDLGIYSTVEKRVFTFKNPGEYVILCHIHPEMAAWVVGCGIAERGKSIG